MLIQAQLKALHLSLRPLTSPLAYTTSAAETAAYVSSYEYKYVRIPLYTCVLILLDTCPHTTFFLASSHYYMCVCTGHKAHNSRGEVVVEAETLEGQLPHWHLRAGTSLTPSHTHTPTHTHPHTHAQAHAHEHKTIAHHSKKKKRYGRENAGARPPAKPAVETLGTQCRTIPQRFAGGVRSAAAFRAARIRRREW